MSTKAERLEQFAADFLYLIQQAECVLDVYTVFDTASRVCPRSPGVL